MLGLKKYVENINIAWVINLSRLHRTFIGFDLSKTTKQITFLQLPENLGCIS